MKAEEFAKTMIFLCNAYRQEMNNTQVSVWYNFFKEIPLNKFNMAVARTIEKNTYFPSIAQLRQEIALIENPELQLDAAEEWEKVLAAIQYHGSYGAKHAMEEFSPVTAAVVKRLGGFTSLCQSDDLEWRRKSFMSIFKETLDRQKEIAAYSQSQLTEAERKRTELVQKALKMIEAKDE